MLNEFIQSCEKLSELFHARYLGPGLNACPRKDDDPWESLRFFLSGYAFERQGRSQDYGPVAADVMREAAGQQLGLGSSSTIWQSFADKMRNQGLNCACNPLCPLGWRYTRSYRGQAVQSVTQKMSIVELIVQGLHGACIVPWARQMVESDRIRTAHNALRRVNGIDSKIASLYLRDVAVAHFIQPTRDRVLLQPIDTWLRFVSRMCSENWNLDDDGCAAFVVANSEQPERANQGIWYFCAQACGSSSYLVRRAHADQARRDDLLRSHLRTLSAGDGAAREFAARWGVQL